MLFKIISIIGSMTFLSRILGYLRDLLIARVIGAGLVSDAFFVAFKLPNLFRRLFAEGSMNSAFIPVISGISSRFGRKKADDFFSNVFSGLLVALLILLITFELFMPIIINLIAPGFVENPEKFNLTVDFSRLAFPFVFFVCLTSLIGAYLNTLGKFAAMAVTPIILNLTLIFTLLIFLRSDEKIYISSLLSFSVSLAGLFQIIWLAYNLKKNDIKLRLNFLKILDFSNPKKETKTFFKLLLPAILGNGAYQLNLLVDMILASTLPHGSISYLYYADRINQLPLGVLGIAISTALLPVLSKQIKKKQKKKANESISSAIKFGILFSIPSFVGLFVLSEEIVSLLFFRGAFEFSDVKLTGMALLALSCGLPAFIMIKILVIPFFANEDTKTPIRVAVISMVINLILNLVLIQKFLHVGLAMATSISAWINALMLFYLLLTRVKISFDKTIVIVLLKVIISSIIMGFLVKQLAGINIMDFTGVVFFDKKNLSLLISVFFGVITYVFMIYLLGLRELNLGKWKNKA